jgi:NAD(P)-dependent dehydrogenase (short-subunit alcohol dehydrogenase family)
MRIMAEGSALRRARATRHAPGGEREETAVISDFAGKVAVVTGGASGIGCALAGRLVREGMRVVIADVEAGPLEAAAEALGAVGIGVDVTSFESVQALARAVRERFGTAHLVCNNAGVSAMAGVRTLSLEDFRWVMDVNFFGVVHGVKAFLPLLDANPDGGHIVNTASWNGLFAMRALGAYAASKYAAVGFSEALDLELRAEGSKVGVSVLCPGPVRTNIRTSARNRGGAYGPTGRREGEPDLHEQAFRGTVRPGLWIEADEAAGAVVEAVREGRFWILTQPELAAPYEARARALAAALERERGAARAGINRDRPDPNS